MPSSSVRYATTLIIGLALASPALSTASEVSLTGEGSVEYIPDSARLRFTAAVEEQDADQATRKVNAMISDWNEAIDQYRGQLNDYTDANLNLYTRSRPEKGGSAELQRWSVASQAVTFSVNDLDLLNPLVSVAQSLGMEYHLGPEQFYHSDEQGFQRKATARAIADARAQCKFVAQELNMSCGRVKSINVNGGGRPVPMMMAEARGSSPVSSIGPRELQVSVSATFELE
ncbi:SIMPL domain-containing protein [Marinobacter salicampi]|uniref:SIMPL domain-containing protein n=1 Tax=Marinobacter salicampi TaxID=435907 RepID=UPI0014073F6B|nr:SIMPL domain-containing protein [Marinobacter salicampi]